MIKVGKLEDVLIQAISSTYIHCRYLFQKISECLPKYIYSFVGWPFLRSTRGRLILHSGTISQHSKGERKYLGNYVSLVMYIGACAAYEFV